MSKEMTPKEALEVIKQRGIEYGDATIGSVFKEECDIVDQALTELEELKRYPTSDEVCEALSEYLGCDVKYNDYGFLMDKDTSIKDLANDKRFDLVTLIGRFYEGLEAQ